MYNEEQFLAMKKGGRILAEILQDLKSKTKPGVTKRQIDEWARRLCLRYKVKPSFLDYDGYPGAICVSINNEIVHGVPSDRAIQDGDLVSLDFGVFCDGYHTDAAISFPVGRVTKDAEKLIKDTEASLYIGIDQAKAGNRIGDIGEAVQTYLEEREYGVVRALVGHGIGREVHEAPMIPNFGESGSGPIIKEGMALAIEPMVTLGNYEVVQAADGWTYETKDNSLSAHFEHTIYITKDGPIILTTL